MPSVKRCIDVYLNHAPNEAGSLSGPMLDMWRIGKTHHDRSALSGGCNAEVKSCAKHGLEPRGYGVVNLISQ
jgi:hypothetical protein